MGVSLPALAFFPSPSFPFSSDSVVLVAGTVVAAAVVAAAVVAAAVVAAAVVAAAVVAAAVVVEASFSFSSSSSPDLGWSLDCCMKNGVAIRGPRVPRDKTP